MKYFLFLILAISPTLLSFSNTYYVGPARTYTLPSQVSNLVNDGDTIYIDGGTYNNNAVKWNKKNLKIIGLGSEGNRTVLKYVGDIPNGKGIFVFELPGVCDNAYIENIVFDGAQVSNANGANGAGIRYQANNLTINNCKFINCQNGILEGHGSVTSSNVTFENSEFENNCYQLPNNANSGYAHNIYISAGTDTLLVQNCYFHHPRGQANSLKTRAQRSFILYNLIDEASGYGSWEINIAQGGLNVIMGNIIIQGPSGSNHGIVGYDAATNPLEDFYFINNTVINKYGGNIKYFNVAPATGINTFKVYNNIFASVNGASNTFMTGNIPASIDTAHNILTQDYLTVGFTNPALNNYSLSGTAVAAINTGVDAGFTNTSYSLTPQFAYQSNTSNLSPRAITGGIIDKGAFESSTTLSINKVEITAAIINSSIRINWTTNLTDITDYTIERTLKGIDFKDIGTLASTTGLIDYSYTDVDILKIAKEASSLYYRLKMKDKNGTINYSKVAIVQNISRDESPSVYPNPFTKELVVKLNVGTDERASISIINLAGATLKKINVSSLQVGSNFIKIEELSQLVAGVYFIKIDYAGKTITQRLVKK